MVSSLTQLEMKIKKLAAREWRAVTLFIYAVIFQIAIFLQIPFLQFDFLYHFYFSIGLIFSHHLYLYFSKIKFHFLSYAFDFCILFYLMSQHPVLTSFNLIVVLILLFIAGSEVSKNTSLALTFFCSALLSVMNLTTIRWEGLQNLFTLVLFNFSFVIVSLISQQYRVQISTLSTELKSVAKKLRSQQEFSDVLIQQMPTGLSAFNQDHRLMFANNSLENKLKLSHQDLLNIFQQNQQKTEAEFLYFNPQIQQKKIYEINLADYFDTYLNEKISLMLLKDVTEVKNLQDQMRQSEKLAAIGQLAAGIAHEIRNPLASISGSIQLLSSETQSPDNQKLMKIILKEIDRLNHLITEFLDYSKPDQRPDQKVDLALIINETVQMIKASPLTPQNLVFQVHLHSFFIYGFTDKLKQAFLNICMNAVQAMSQQEKPMMSITMESLNDHEIQLIIKDNGSGMPQEIQKRIFEPFFTTKSKGTGLGLAITHKVLQSHQAKVQIVSEPGAGTEFILNFKKA